MTDKNESVGRIDTIAAALVARAGPTTFRVAVDRADVEAAQRLRGLAVLDRGWAQTTDLTDGREEDADDDRAVHILATLSDEPIGTCRLIYPEEGRLLPMEQVRGASRLPNDAVEVGRVVVIHSVAREQRTVLTGLIGSAWLELRAHGHQHICGIVSAPMLRLFRRLGFVVHVVGPVVTTFGEERYPILFEPTSEAAAVVETRHANHRP